MINKSYKDDDAVINNKYIATIIKYGNTIKTINTRVLFKAKGKTYVKKFKGKNKLRPKKYVESESVNIICNDLNNDYVIIDSDNMSYYNKYLLILCVIGIFAGIILPILIGVRIGKISIMHIIVCFVFFSLIMFLYLLYIYYIQPKKRYKKYTAITEGQIIDYRRTENLHNPEDSIHCDYNIMYKFKDSNGNIIHSVLNRYSAQLLYKDYPINKKIIIRYNPLKSCESCLEDEYKSIYTKEKIVKNGIVEMMTTGLVTNITVKCIDKDVADDLKEYFLSDLIECEYTISNTTYKTYSLFSVTHNMFKIGDSIRIFYDNNDKNVFWCDTKTKYGRYDKI